MRGGVSGLWEGEEVSDYIPDPIELGESMAERALDAICQPDGRFKCYRCDAIFDPDKEGGYDSPNPYTPPCCGKCLEMAMRFF